MPNFAPFEPDVKAGVAGFTQAVALGGGAATSQAITMSRPGANSVLVTLVNNNASGGAIMAAYVRMSVEGASIVASSTDTPLVAAAQGDAVRLFAAPAGEGISYNIAVVVTVTPSTPGTIFFTPGSGGDV